MQNMTNTSITIFDNNKKNRAKMPDELGNVCAVKNDIKNMIEDHFGQQETRRVEISSSASYTTIQTEDLLSEQTTSFTGDTTQDFYKMKAYGRRGHKSPTRIEFFVTNNEKSRSSKQTKTKTPKPKVFKKYHCLNTKSALSLKPDYVRQSLDHVNQENNFKPQTPTENDVKIAPSGSIFKDSVKRKISTTFGGCCLKNDDIGDQTLLVNSTNDYEEGNKECDNNSKQAETEIRKNIEIYYFDHGNSAYFQTTDYPPHIFSEILAQQTINHATRFWAEIFGSVHIGVAFIISFFMQGYRFLLYSLVRPVSVGFIQMTSDYFIKPFLAIIFNGLLQPVMILLYNIFSSICDMLKPIADIIGHFLQPVTRMLSKIRLVEINKKNYEKKFDRINNI